VCCGKNRVQQRTGTSISTSIRQDPGIRTGNAEGLNAAQAPVYFAYVGSTGLTVNGPVTGNRYRFDRPGARVRVNPRDQVLLASIRQLKRVP
jgi:hypothetical protein